MSGTHCTDQKLSGVNCHSLRDPVMLNLLRDYLGVLRRLLGPKGGTLMVQHSGGLDAYVCSSAEMINKTRPHHPCIKFINCLMEGQEAAYGLFGMYVGILCTSLLIEMLTLESKDVPQRVIETVASLTMDQMLAKMNDQPSLHVTKLDLCKLPHMISLVKTCICSKNVGLNDAEKDHLSSKIVEAFLLSVPSKDSLNSFGDVVVSNVEGRPVTEARVVPGVLCRDNHPNLTLIDEINKKVESKPTREKSNLKTTGIASPSALSSFHKYSRNLTMPDDTDTKVPPNTRTIRILLFNVPLSFEQSETECLTFSGDRSSSETFDDFVSRRLLCICKTDDIAIVACQKVISPVVQWRLEKAGILALERLGTVTCEALRKLTACLVISDVTLLQQNGHEDNKSDGNSCNDSFVGYVGQLTSINILEITDKTYIQFNNVRREMQHVIHYTEKNNSVCHRGLMKEVSDNIAPSHKTSLWYDASEPRLQSTEMKGELTPDQDTTLCQGTPVVTLLLPSLLPATQDCLKTLVESGLRLLKQVCGEPTVCGGGGCVEVWLAVQMWRDVALWRDPDVGQAQYEQVLGAIGKVFVNLAVLLKGGSVASNFDFCFNPSTGHLYDAGHEDNVDNAGHEDNVDKELRATSADDKCACGSENSPSKQLEVKMTPVRSLFDNSLGSFWGDKTQWSASSFSSSRMNSSAQKELLDQNRKLFTIGNEVIVESFYAKMNALRLAFEGAMQLYAIDYCIFDR